MSVRSLSSSGFVNDILTRKQENRMGFDLKALTEPFDAKDIQWRAQQAGITNGKPWARVLAYVDARAIQARLDMVVGPENWRVEYQPVGSAFLCGLSIRCGTEWVTKWDGSDETDIESFKGGISKALVRAASVWGIGRYLYDLPADWATFGEKSDAAYEAKIENKKYYWYPPELPAWAKPGFSAAPGFNEYRETIAPETKKKERDEARKNTRSRNEINRVLMALFRPYMTKFPDAKFSEILDERYHVRETRLMTIEQLEDLAKFLEQEVGPNSAA